MQIELPPDDDLGPAMLALPEQRRRFVIAYTQSVSGNATEAARLAGYSDSSEGAKVAAHRLLHDERIVAAIQEWTERAVFGRGAYIGIQALIEIAADPEHRDRFKAADSLADRTGFARQTNHQVRVENADTRHTADLLEAIGQFMEARRPEAIEGQFKEVPSADRD